MTRTAPKATHTKHEEWKYQLGRADSKRASSGTRTGAGSQPVVPTAVLLPLAPAALGCPSPGCCCPSPRGCLVQAAQEAPQWPAVLSEAWECPASARGRQGRCHTWLRAGTMSRPGRAAGPGCTDGLLLAGSKLHFSSLRGCGYSVTAAHLSAHNKQNAHCYCCRCCTP